ncbi:VCBS domain-containing protein, partial [Sphingomonas sp. GCM10030256]|uniref:VCBS domain-containing protein n=1 Tax=Sphingomonas sp. GCM10030256 TaxID=3273427 RepID=UPI00360CD231
VAADGTWSYALDNGLAAIQQLPAGETLTDTLTVASKDGTATQQIVVTITGTNDAAVIGDSTVASVTEDVAVSNGNLVASGSISISDADQNQGAFQTTVTGGQGNLGSLTLAANGSYTYLVANSATQYLGLNQIKVDTFTVMALDGTTKQVSFTITGTNDGPVIGDPTVAAVTEDVAVSNGNLVASGSISISDADQNQTSFQTAVTGAQGNLGSLTLAANGSYTYSVANSATQYLALNETKVDTFTVTALDGTTKQVSFTITGANDAAVIGGTKTGNVTEATPNNAGTPTASGTLTAADVDNSPNSFRAVTSAQASSNGYGAFTLTAAGVWTYTLNNSNVAVDALNNGQSLSDSFTVQSADGTSEVVTILIAGATDTITLVPPPVFDGADPNDFDTLVGTSAVNNSANINGDNQAGDNITGGSADQNIDGKGGNDTIYAGGGKDTVTGNTGDDLLYGQADDDSVSGNGGEDTLYGGSGNDALLGSNENDVMYGGSGTDSLQGDNGNDVLIGGYGADKLSGGNDVDTFRFLDVKDTGDTITDFVLGTDKLDFSAIDANSSSAGNQQFAWGGDDPTAFGIWYAQVGGNTILYADTDGNAATAEFMVTLQSFIGLNPYSNPGSSPPDFFL